MHILPPRMLEQNSYAASSRCLVMSDQDNRSRLFFNASFSRCLVEGITNRKMGTPDTIILLKPITGNLCLTSNCPIPLRIGFVPMPR